MGATESQYRTKTKLERIAWLSTKDSSKEFQCLMHLFNEESLYQCFRSLDGRKAVGIDGVNRKTYEENISQNIQELVSRMKRMAYKPGPVKLVLIPKEGSHSKMRELGISNFEDKLIQKMTQRVLNSIYEPIFLPSSYGFREGLGCHDAVRALSKYLFKEKVETVIDLDLANFFGTIDHDELIKMLRMKVKDEKFIRHIKRMFKSGVLSKGELNISEEGIVQGSVCSPTLANIFAHYVIDEWFEKVVKPHCKGNVELFRYCDDACIVSEYNSDALRIKEALSKRLAKFGLSLNQEKTKLVPFSKINGKKGTFDFLGFTFYLGKSRNGYYVPKVKTSSKRIKDKLKRANQWAKSVRSRYPLKTIWRMLCKKLEGHVRYFGVSYNSKYVALFIRRVRDIMFKWLNRRSDKRTFTWEKYELFLKAHPLPKPKVYHNLLSTPVTRQMVLS